MEAFFYNKVYARAREDLNEPRNKCKCDAQVIDRSQFMRYNG